MNRYGIFRKGTWTPIIIVDSYEEAQRLLEGYEHVCEIREVIEHGQKAKRKQRSSKRNV